MTQNQKEIILNRLTEMGCKDIVLEEISGKKIVAHFDCDELTSFNAPVGGWKHSGIGLDDSTDSNKRLYKIIFAKDN